MSVKTKVVKMTATKLVVECVDAFKNSEPKWKSMDESDLYAIEGLIDGRLYDADCVHLAPGYGSSENDELILERLTFDAIHKLQGGKRHSCDG